jgi:DNA invertase Pin-like site-specific DNA recombinase
MSNKSAALYVRVSTDAQTVENQIRELRQVARRRGWDVVEVYSDAGISGAKGRNGRPGLDSMLKDSSRRKFFARHRDWHGAAHLRRASDESAKGGAMKSRGE